MSSLLSTIRNFVIADLGGRADSTALLLIDHGINTGILLAAILFKPIELRKFNSITYSANATSYDMSGIKWLDIPRVRDTTNNKDLFFIPFNILDRVLSSNLTSTKYYSLFGTKLFLRKIPANNTGLTIYILEYPSELTDANDAIPFDGYDSFIRSTATVLCQAAFEESEAVNMWNGIATQLTSIFSLGADIKSSFGYVKAYLDQMINIAQSGK